VSYELPETDFAGRVRCSAEFGVPRSAGQELQRLSPATRASAERVVSEDEVGQFPGWVVVDRCRRLPDRLAESDGGEVRPRVLGAFRFSLTGAGAMDLVTSFSRATVS
jgi:hypothetical protein